MNQGYIVDDEFNEFSQKIAEAIEAVTKIDVTIMDANRNRIAATGEYQEPKFGNVADKSAFVNCLETGEICIIEEAGSSEICRGCSSLHTCIEEAEICVPITFKNKAIGVVALIAFDVDQKKILLDNCEAYVNFLQKMASLLEAKYGEIIALEENRRLTQKMKSIVNSIKREKYLVMLDDDDEFKKELMKVAEKSCEITFQSILSVSSVLHEVKEMAAKISDIESPILIRGESGTGKELFARAMHNWGKRNKKPFIAINCGAIPDELLESELFGYEKGAFTGAHNSKLGKFEIANGGTIFLDEIGELPMKLQVKLLRVLQERELSRLGSNEVKKIDVRIYSATNVNLEKRMKENLFREDLYYRLNIFPIHIPPLRERKEDIAYLTDYFLNYYNNQYEKDIKGLSEEVREMFLAYQWPGNVRELQNVMEFAVCLETKDCLSGPLISRRLGLKEEGSETLCQDGENYSKLRQDFSQLLNKYEQLSNKERIARICEDLNISRATFYRKKKEIEKG